MKKIKKKMMTIRIIGKFLMKLFFKKFLSYDNRKGWFFNFSFLFNRVLLSIRIG